MASLILYSHRHRTSLYSGAHGVRGILASFAHLVMINLFLKLTFLFLLQDDPKRLAEVMIEFWRRNKRVVAGVKKVEDS